VPSRGDARADAEVGSIIGPAWSWRWQAPELALVFGERALRTADQRGDQLAVLWARTLVVSASCRVGQQLAVVDTAIDALRLSERLAADDAGAILRVELAGCARSAGVPLVGAGLLRPVLSAADVRPAVRAAALIQLAGCLAYSERHRELDGALAEADQLYADDRELDQNARLGLRAVLRSFVAREHRRRGDLRSALHAAEEGADLLAGLTDLTADGGASARISLQQVLGLLDLGWIDQACTVAASALSGPVRAHSAAAVGWLALAISTRVQLPAGLIGPAIALLREIASIAERHHRDALHAECLSTLSEAHELAGELAETLDHLRSAQVIRARRSRALRSARSALLGAFGEARNPDDLLRLLNPTLSTGRRRAVDRDEPLFGQGTAKAVPDASGVTLVLIDVAKNRSTISSTTPAPTTAGIGTWTAESLGAGSRAGDPIGEGVLRKVVEQLRDITPAEAALARIGGAELAVLLPGNSRAQIERWAEELRAAMANVDWSQVTPGLTVNVRTVVTDHHPSAETTTPEPRSARPATGVALDAQPARSRRSGERTSPRLPIPQQPTEPDRAATLATDPPVPPARTPTEPEQSGGRRSRGGAPAEEAKPVRTPLPQASWPGITEPLPDKSAPRKHAAAQEPTQRWTPVWDSIDDEDTGRWRVEPVEEPQPTPETAPPTGLDRFGLGSAVFGTGIGKRRSEDKQETPSATPQQSTTDPERSASRHSVPQTESARSVLDSLAISAGSGGRRRAPEPTETHEPTPDPETTGRRARRDYSQPFAGFTPTAQPSRGGRRRAEDTIPQIKLPQLPLPPALMQQAAAEQPQPAQPPTNPQPPLAQTPAAPPQFDQAPAAEPPFGQTPAAPPQFGQAPAEPPFGQAPTAQPPLGQAPTAEPPFGQAPTAEPPFGQATTAPSPSGQAPAAPQPFGRPGAPLFGQPAVPVFGPPQSTPPQPAAPQQFGVPAAGPQFYGLPTPEPQPYGQAPAGSQPPHGTQPTQYSAQPTQFGAQTPPYSAQPVPYASQSAEPPSFGYTPVEPPSYGAEPSAFGQTPAAPAEPKSSPGHASGLADFRSGFFLGQAAAAAASPESTQEAATAGPVRQDEPAESPRRGAHQAPAFYEAPPAAEPPAAEVAAPEPLESFAPPAGDPESAEGGSSFSALSEFSAMLARFDDPQPSALELSEPSTTPLRPPSAEPTGLPEPETTPPARADRSRAAQPFAPETMFGSGALRRPEPEPEPVEPQTPPERVEAPPAHKPAAETPVTQQPAAQSPAAQSAAAQSAVTQQPATQTPAAHTPATQQPVTPPPAAPPPAAPPPAAPPPAVQPPVVSSPVVQQPVVPPVVEKPAPERSEGLRPSPPPTGIAAKLGGPHDAEAESDVASIEGRSARGRRRSPKLGDLLTEALRAYQDVRESDEGQNALAAASEPSELGATELGNWLGTGTEPIGSIDAPSWRPGSSTRSFGVARHSSGDDSGDSRRPSGPDDWRPPTG
jgi:hypothetical protein